MSLDLNLALTTNPTLEMDEVEAYGMETAPCQNYVNTSRKVASEYILKVSGRKYRVYSWTADSGEDSMYILKSDRYRFISKEVQAMLHYGEPSYGGWTQVAQRVTVAA